MSGSDTSDIISQYLQLLRRPHDPPEVAVSVLSTAFPKRDNGAPCALILSPHPDDECLTAALPLRLKHEKWQIINVAVTLGSAKERHEARKVELSQACTILGFDCILSDQDGFSNVNWQTRESDALAWQTMVGRLSQIIALCKPTAIFIPHAQDAHPTHIGTHLLGMDALAKQIADFQTSLVLTEYWQPLEDPNLMIGMSDKNVATLFSALSCHVGENARNPFDVRFPAYLIDNVRRGSERVGSKGSTAASMDFAMLYKLGIWKNGKFVPSALRRIVEQNEAVASLFD